MSERELNRIEVLSSVDDGTMTATRAGDLLNLSRRQIQRLARRLRNEGAGGKKKSESIPCSDRVRDACVARHYHKSISAPTEGTRPIARKCNGVVASTALER